MTGRPVKTLKGEYGGDICLQRGVPELTTDMTAFHSIGSSATIEAHTSCEEFKGILGIKSIHGHVGIVVCVLLLLLHVVVHVSPPGPRIRVSIARTVVVVVAVVVSVVVVVAGVLIVGLAAGVGRTITRHVASLASLATLVRIGAAPPVCLRT